MGIFGFVASAVILVGACTGSINDPSGPGGSVQGARGGGPGASGEQPVGQRPEPLVCNNLGTVGAPVPMRRLTRAQVERSVRDVLGVEDALSASDERLHSAFASNVSTAIDANGARAYYDYAERVAGKVDLKRCNTAAACTAWLFDEVALRLFRQPLTAEQRTRYDALYKQGEADGARWVLAALLQSPSFLYLDEGERDGGFLDDYAIAARLALVVWGQSPDLALLMRAAKNELREPGVLASEAKRLLADARSQGGIQDFVDQWLELRRLDDPDARPDLEALGKPVLTALRQEPIRFFQALLARKEGLDALLTSSRSVKLDALTATYGSDIKSSTTDAIELDPARRAGILTLPGVMAAHAHAQATSPTLRGFNVMAHFLCAPPPPPPANVSARLPDVGPSASARERLEAHFSDDTCGSCHRTMDGVGFAFEGIDWLGRSRSKDMQGRSVDDAAKLSLLGTDIDVKGAVPLMQALNEHEAVAGCVAKQWARYASGVLESQDSQCLLQKLGTQLREQDGLAQMMLTYLSSDWFRRGRGSL